MTLDEITEKVKETWPEWKKGYDEGIGPELLVAMHILETNCNAGGTEKVALIVDIGEQTIEDYVRQLRTAARFLGQEVRSRCEKAASIPHRQDERLYWLQNWGFTPIETPPEEKNYRLKMSIRGGWVWLTDVDRHDILAGRQLDRFSLPEPKIIHEGE